MLSSLPLAALPTLVAALSLVTASAATEAAAAEPVQFNRDIRPILSNHCFNCHGPDASTREADLRLDTQAGLLGDGQDAAGVVVPGKPEVSLLWQRITADDSAERMPPQEYGKPLSDQQKALIRRWIEEGAQWQGHWAFVPPTRPAVPQVERGDWPATAIDAFLLARMEAAGASPSPPADRVTLLRRLSLDLTGLAPTPEEVSAFLADTRPGAWERQVERLLASPHFGERMAVYWLDLVRYGDSGGYHSDNTVHISPYRDYVIHAFNDNLPFDRFTREQLAGDLLPSPSTEQIVAAGYNRLNKTTEEGGAQPQEYLAKYAADRVRATAGAWLGATLGCAECHDHKYDPYTMRDFYSFAAFFADVKEQGKYGGNGKRDPELMVPNRFQETRLNQIAQEEMQLEAALAKSPAPEEQPALKQRLAALAAERKAIEANFTRTMITVSVQPREMRILPRGDWMDRSGEVVQPAVPRFLESESLRQTALQRRLTRLDLAGWITSPDNPLTARVFVNRLWKLFYGAGLSRDLDDVGAQGQWPTHPALLDYLAVEFVESGWDIKHMVRLMVTARAYRQTSQPSPELLETDPANELFARQNRWRLEAEFIRDHALAVSGLLVRHLGGKSVYPYQPAGYWDHLNFPTRKWVADTGANQYRRGLYTHWQRTFLHPMLLAFDAPSREECVAQRPVSNTPKAALTLLNDPTFVEAARALAARTLLQGPADDDARLTWLWQQVLARPPLQAESQVLAELLAANREHYRTAPQEAKKLLSVGQAVAPASLDAAEVAAWTAVCRTLLNLHETITRE